MGDQENFIVTQTNSSAPSPQDIKNNWSPLGSPKGTKRPSGKVELSDLGLMLTNVDIAVI